MGRKPKNRDNAPVAEQAVSEVDQSDNATVAETTTMGAFEKRTDRDQYLTIRQAAQHIYGSAYEPKNDQSVRNALKKRDEFKAPGALINVTVEGYDIPPLTYVHVDAVNAYHAANQTGGTSRGRLARGGAQRFILRVTPDQKAALETLFASQDGLTGLTFEPASTAKPRKGTPAASADGAADVVSSDAAPAANTLDGIDVDVPADDRDETSDQIDV
jgi:hypothetical protein